MKILFRVDATISAGTGHMSRCLALAEEFISTGNDVVVMGHTDEVTWIQNRINALGVTFMPIRRAEVSETLIKSLLPDLVVFDSYEFDINLINSVSKKFFTMAIVDTHSTRIIANVYLNQNLGADEIDFKSPKNQSSKVFLGGKFALIRENLLQVRDEYQLRSAKQPVVTCFIGGSNLSDKVFEVSKFLAKFDIGPKFNFVVEESQQFLISKIMKKHDLNFHIPTPNLDRILLESDSVICGAGSSVLEMHCIGIPTAYIPVADNQLSSLRKILENHSGILLTENPNTNIKASKIEVLNSIFYDNEIRTRMFNKSRSVVDGLGKKRLVNSIFS